MYESGSDFGNGPNAVTDVPSPPPLPEHGDATRGTRTLFTEPNVHALYPIVLPVRRHVIFIQIGTHATTRFRPLSISYFYRCG